MIGKEKVMRVTLIWAAVFSFVVSQIYPGSYEVSSNVISESGSSDTGHCSSVADSGRVCNSPRSSVLFDGIPTLTELDGDMWASQLLAFNTSASPASITFNFTTTSDRNGPTFYTGVQTIEVVMFNCPARGIGTNNIIVSDEVTTIKTTTLDTALMNCSYLVRICIDLTTTVTLPILNFGYIYQRLYIAEVIFYSNPNRCFMAGPIISAITTTLSEKIIKTTNCLPLRSNPETTANIAAATYIISATTINTTSITATTNIVTATTDNNTSARCNVASSIKYSLGVLATASVFSFFLGTVFGIFCILLLCMMVMKFKKKLSQNINTNNDVNMENTPSAMPEAVLYEDVLEAIKDVELQQNDVYGKL